MNNQKQFYNNTKDVIEYDIQKEIEEAEEAEEE